MAKAFPVLGVSILFICLAPANAILVLVVIVLIMMFRIFRDPR